MNKKRAGVWLTEYSAEMVLTGMQQDDVARQQQIPAVILPYLPASLLNIDQIMLRHDPIRVRTARRKQTLTGGHDSTLALY